jgi:hypothetical protein
MDLVTNLHLVFKFGFQSNCMVVDFSSTKQLNFNLQCNYTNFHNHYHVVLIIIDNVELHWTSSFISMKWT